MKFDFGDDYESPTFEYAEEQPKHSAMIAPARRRFEDRAGLIDCGIACAIVTPR